MAAATALDSSSRAAHQQEIALLLRLLIELGEDAKALPLLEHVATPGVLDDDKCKRLVMCVQRLDRHDTLLRIWPPNSVRPISKMTCCADWRCDSCHATHQTEHAPLPSFFGI